MKLDDLRNPPSDMDLRKWFADLAECTGWSSWCVVAEHIIKRCGTKTCGDLFMEADHDINAALEAAQVHALPNTNFS